MTDPKTRALELVDDLDNLGTRMRGPRVFGGAGHDAVAAEQYVLDGETP